jgi:hypothetical protein
MTAGMLIAILKDMPPETMIVVDGYEGNCDEVAGTAYVEVVPNPGPSWDGQWRIIGKYDTEGIVKAFGIWRPNW